MICNATYDSFESIPDIAVGDGRLRDEFHQVKGKWVLKDDAVPGVGPLFNSGLAANEQRALDQLKRKRDDNKRIQEELDEAKDKLAVLDTPGAKILTKEDGVLFDQYVALGTPKELKTKLDQSTEAIEKVTQFETAEALKKVAVEGSGINPAVLADWASSKLGEGITFFTKTVTEKDAKGVETSVEVPMVKVEKDENGKVKTSEHELLPFAKEHLEDWRYAALTSATGGGQSTPSVQQPKGARLPSQASASRAPKSEDTKERPVDRFNKARDAKPNPFAPKQAGTPGVVPMAGSAHASAAVNKV